jgi:hypothetical protein
MKTSPRIAFGGLVFFFAAILLPGSVAAQQLSVSPSSISVQVTAGTNTTSRTLQVKKKGKPTAQIAWTVVEAPEAAWLSVTPTTGINDATLTLNFATSSLAVGQYQTSVRVQSSGSTDSVNVQLSVVSSVSQLVANCPANQTASSNGSAVPVSYVIPTPSGGTSPYFTSGTPASGSNFNVGQTTVTVTAQDSSQPQQTDTCTFTVTVTNSAPSALIANCPAAKTASSANASAVPVSYVIPTPSGGTSPYFTSGSPASGSNFNVGQTTVTVTAQDSSQPTQTDTCTFTVTVTYTPPPSSNARGPQSTITCPTGALNVFPTDSITTIQNLINANAGGTFCFRAGVYHLDRSITPNTGSTFVGEYGAILDGTGWSSFDDSQAAFRIYDDPNDPNDPNTDVDNVTIRNFVIRNMPHYGIHASHTRHADHWLIENNEVASNRYGVMFTRDFTIRNNYIHDNVGNPTAPLPGDRGGGYVGQYADNTILDNNEIARNGPEQKVGLSINVTFSNNWVHHNLRDGIWYDLNNNPATAPLAARILNNIIEDNRGNGIVFEISIGADIANNIFRRNGEDAVLITVSQSADIHNNLLEANFGAVEYFLNCGSFSEGFDLRNNSTHDNTIFVSTLDFSYANGFSHLSQCTSTQLAPYINGSKNLTFYRNTYHVPSLSFTRYFLWSGWKDWTQWRALIANPPGHDLDGSMVSP